MWCIPKVTPEFVERMEDVLDLYARPYDRNEPVICFDEKSKELRGDARAAAPTKEGRVRRRDYEYVRNGTANVFMAVEPKGGYRRASATARRTRADFAHEIRRIIRLPRYRRAKAVHVVLDNLNTHDERSLAETLGKRRRPRSWGASGSTTRPSTPRGSTWRRRSFRSWSGSARGGASATASRCDQGCPHGNGRGITGARRFAGGSQRKTHARYSNMMLGN